MSESNDDLEETQRRLERTTLSIQEGHWEVDVDTGKHWASNSYLALLGYPPQPDLLDTAEKAQQLVHPEDWEMSYVVMQRHLAAGTPYEVEIRLRLANGSYRWFKLRGFAEADANGKASRI